jgi:hypothetical protein
MPDERAAEYLAKAEECRTEAGRAAHEDERASWLRMAEEWLKLSRGVARDVHHEEHLKTRLDGHTHPVHESKIVSR